MPTQPPSSSSPSPRSGFVAGFALLLLLALLASGCASLPGSNVARVRQTPFEWAQQGSGRPTVVFEAGAGDGMQVWSEVYNQLQADCTVFAYSRRGHGKSGPLEGDPTGASVVEDLRHLLAERNLPPPYVLVGHSLGGLYVQLYAKEYPNEVAGVVLVDATTWNHEEQMRLQQPAAYQTIQALKALNAFSTLGAELRGVPETAEQWQRAPAFPPKPAVVLTATKPPVIGGPAFVEFTTEQQRQLTAQWPGAEQWLVNCGHYIQREKPDTVVNAIRYVLRRIKAG